jgi:DNA ligase-1
MPSLKPMLAGKAPEDLDRLRFPVLASAKLDGVRALVVNGQVLSRTLKPIPNKHTQRLFGNPRYNGLDGELIVGSPSDPNCMQHTMSGVMSREGEPLVQFYAFDQWDRKSQPFQAVVWSLAMREDLPTSVIAHPHETISNVSQLESFEADVLSAGYEGLILRDPRGPYKFNRSTTKEGWMLKLKRFAQDEAVVISVEELMHNLNEATLDERGYTKRSSAQDGKMPSGTLGALVCRQLVTSATGLKQPSGPVFNIGTGFDAGQRKHLWNIRQYLPGRVVSFKHFAQQGVLEAPRHPVFISFRDKIDL